jgi:DNA-binding MarR family transcriptional regulator
MKLRNKSNKINRLRRIRSWELKNLPIYGTDAGYALFLEIAALEELNDVSLKSLYLSMPYAESTIRLLFRNLEEDGWVELRKHVVDQRIKTFTPTQKFSFVVDQWLDHVDECLGTD